VPSRLPVNDSITRLEEKIAYLERHVTAQDRAMLEFADEIAVLRKEIKALRERGSGGGSGRDSSGDELADERPPHY